jgi:hypothetical protein
VVTDQRFGLAVFPLHLDEQDFVVDGTKPLDLDANRAADRPLDRVLRGAFQRDRPDLIQLAEPFFPSRRKRHMGGAGVDERIAPKRLVALGQVFYPHGGGDPAHGIPFFAASDDAHIPTPRAWAPQDSPAIAPCRVCATVASEARTARCGARSLLTAMLV